MTFLHRLFIPLLLLAPVTTTAPVRADDRATASGDTPDVVQLKNGGLVRGVILEMLPGESVVIRSALGDIRKFPVDEVAYAGPSARAPSAPVPPAPAPSTQDPVAPTPPARPPPPLALDPNLALVQFRSTSGELILFRRSTERVGISPGREGVRHHDERICQAPCTTMLPAGTHRFVLFSSNHPESLPVKTPVTVTSGDTLIGAYLSQEHKRKMYLLAAAITGGAGISPALAGILLSQREDSTGLKVMMYSGIVLTLVGAGLLIPALTLRDEVSLRVVPGTPAPLGPSHDRGLRAQHEVTLPTESSWQGLSLVGQF